MITNATATLELDLPPSWQVVTPFERKGKRFIVEQSHRRVDQPKGWMIAGRLDRIEETIAGTRVLMAAPRSHDARLRDLFDSSKALERCVLHHRGLAFFQVGPIAKQCLPHGRQYRCGVD